MTERKRVEENLRLFSQAVDGSIEGIAIGDPQHDTITYVNEALTRMFGYSREQLIGQRIAFVYPEEQLAKLKEALKATMEGGWTGELVGRKKDGELFPLAISASTVVEDEGHIIAYMASHQDIADRKRTEAQLRETTELLQSIMNSATEEMIAATDRTGTILSWNEGARRLLGYEPEEVVGKESVRIFHTEDYRKSGRIDANIRTMIATREPLVEELTYVAKDGKTLHVQQIVTPRFGEDGEFIGMLGLARDMTERRRAEQALEESRERFRALAESTSDWAWEVDGDGVYTYASPRVKDLLGYDAQEVVGKTPFDFMPPVEAKRVASRFRATAKSRKPFAGLENTNVRKDGRLVVLETSGVPIFDARNRFCGYRGIDRDITRRKRAEEKLRHSEELFRTVVNASKDAMVAIDRKGLITIFNPAAEQMFQRKSKEVTGRPLNCLMPEEYWEPHRQYVKSYFTTGAPDKAIGKMIELPAMRADGAVFPVELSLSAGQRGAEPFVLAVIRDITERKGAEEQLRKAHQELEQRVRDRTADLTAANQLLRQEMAERRRVEEALRESEELMRQVTDASPNCIFLKDHDGRFLLVNKQMAEAYGTTPEAMVGRTDLDFVGLSIPTMELAERFLSTDREVIQSKRVKLLPDEPFTLPDGTIRWHQATKIPLSTHESTDCVLGVAVDITDRKKAEQTLQQRIEFDALITAISTRFINLPPDAIDQGIDQALRQVGEFAGVDRSYVFQFSEDGTRMTNTHEWCSAGIRPEIDNLQNLPAEELPWFMGHMRRFEVLHVPRVADLPPEARAEQQHFRQQDIQSLVVLPMACEGSLIGFVGFDSVGAEKTWPEEIVALLRIVGDIFANTLVRKRAEEALRESEERFRGLFEATFEAVLVHDQGIILDANRAFERLVGCAFSEAVGKSLFDFVAPAARDLVSARMRSGSQEPYEAQALTQDGRVIDVEVVGKEHTYQGRKVRVAALRDITERKRAEEVLRRADRLAALGTMVAGVAHELNNPLTAVCGLSQLLTKDQSLDKRSRQLADEIIEQGIRCGKIVEDLLGFARVRPVRHQPVQINQLLNRCLEWVRHDSPFEDLEVVEDYSSSVPMTMADPYRLEQVFINVIRNAGDALKLSPPPKRLEVRSRRAGNEIRIDFTDNGPGIAEPGRVFDPFYTTRGAGEGTGLGLSVSYGIIEEHGGRITARNVSTGARFTIRLPIHPAPGEH